MLKQLWDESGWARRLILIMLPINVISQFFPYNTYQSKGLLLVNYDFSSTLFWWWNDPTGTGWQLHPQAYVILACLVVVYLNDVSKGRFWTRFGYWLTVPLTFATLVPGSAYDIGGTIGVGCLLLSIIAAIISVSEARRMEAPTPAKQKSAT